MAVSSDATGLRHSRVVRSPIAAATLALALSAILHLLLISQVDVLPAFLSWKDIERPRFRPIEMTDVRRAPPPPLAKPQEDPSGALLLDADRPVATPAVMPELGSPRTVALPLPPPEPSVAAQAPEMLDPVTASQLRQEVMAIQDRMVPEEAAALPRRWVEQDIPRIEQAPDIQLPVDVPATLASGAPVATVPSVRFVESQATETPEWTALMFSTASQQGSSLSGDREGAGIAAGQLFDEQATEVSSLQSIDRLLQVDAEGFVPPGGTNLYVRLRIRAVEGGPLQPLPRDILFIQDSSESMTPWKLDECRRGLKRWLDFLNPGDRFEIMGFRDSTYVCFNGWMPYDGESRGRAVTFIESMRALGDTDVYKSLEAALSVPFDAGRTPLIVLVTDGRPTVGITGSSEIIEGITRYNRGHIAMYTVGGGKKVNSFFLDLLSYRNRGEAMVARGEEEIPAVMESWARELRRPVLTDLSCIFSKVDPTEIYPKQLSHLFLDRPLEIYGRFPAGIPSVTFQVVGRSGEQWHDVVFTLEREAIATGDALLRSQWAWQRIYHMIGDYLGDATEDRLESIRDFADSYGLLVPYGFSRAMPRGDGP